MKKVFPSFMYVFVCIVGLCCMYGNGHTDISISEDEHSYSMNAHFSKSKMRNVEEYMDSRIGRKSNISFTNTRIDAILTLDDHTKFYLNKSQGTLEIKFDKDENSDESYREIKSMCEGIKKSIVK